MYTRGRETKMERRVIAVCIAVGFLGLLAAALGFAAEAKRIKRSQIHSTPVAKCGYPKSPAQALGSIAALALLISNIILGVAICSIWCRRGPRVPGQSKSKWILAFICLIISWLTFATAFILFLGGATLSAPHHGDTFFDKYCYVVKPGVFAGAAALSLASVVFGLVYFMGLASANDPWAGAVWPNQMAGPVGPNPMVIAMGRPALDLRHLQERVHVHEVVSPNRRLTFR